MACCSTSGRPAPKKLNASAAVEPATVPTVALDSMRAPEPGHFVDNYTAFREQHRIRGYEAGPDQKANIITIANLLQVWGRYLGWVGVGSDCERCKPMRADGAASAARIGRQWRPACGNAMHWRCRSAWAFCRLSPWGPLSPSLAYRDQCLQCMARAEPPCSMCVLTQEVGANHGVSTWGRSASGLAAMPGLEHLVFVATRMQIRMDAYPSW